MLLRTAKSCGPDAPTLASSSRMLCRPYRARTKRQSANDGGKRARSPGRARRKPLKPLRAGMPGDSGVLVVARVRSTTPSAHEAAGAAGTRHSPRPLRGRKIHQSLGRIAPRESVCRTTSELHQNYINVIARSVSDEAIHSFFALRDGLLRFARNDGRTIVLGCLKFESTICAGGVALPLLQGEDLTPRCRACAAGLSRDR